MNIEEKLGQILSAQDKAFMVTRSYYQHLDKYGLPPLELIQAYKKYQEVRVFCDGCKPSLIMIPSPTCYDQNKLFWANYFKVEHNVRSLNDIEHPFEGIRGVYFPFEFPDDRQHADIVEMDNSDYFNKLTEDEKITFMTHFFMALQEQGGHASLSSSVQDRNHVTIVREAYVGVVSRNHPDYNLRIDKLIKIDGALYQRGYPNFSLRTGPAINTSCICGV